MSERTVQFAMRVTPEEHAALKRLGGARWIRMQMKAPPLVADTSWRSLDELSSKLREDPRQAKVVARDFGVPINYVYRARGNLTRRFRTPPESSK